MVEAEDEAAGKEAAGGAVLRQLLRRTYVNPNPVPYWGDHSELQVLCEGATSIDSDENGRAFAAFHCKGHGKVEADPDLFAFAMDRDGFCGVHACALNGFLETLQALVEHGGAMPFVQTRAGVDALMIARRRGHHHILDYLTQFEGEQGVERLALIRKAVEERRQREALANEEYSQESLSSVHEFSLEEAQRRREERLAEAKAKALEASRMLFETKAKPVETLPRKFWQAEWVQLDEKRGVGFYPRKPFAEA
uniref:Uncharacterized protein n=1 Tax=Rhizochromulina marina TaxID=1034831 RepID=A0A7S2W1F5_9STRA|mmetsp:Transcript_12077/g.34928  ORF Transcript_12077/g.34928 Transcript_12077/m.34928 type:complete len:252 (+) Transcript_12077:87-842(+)|eukprot:CAMPEP_0118990008 /NCGR_PEP_ID=MMETSP1173-20130426/49050_1 /TAXON_ID=1034831 /ORGANISM="Rhizochromulina marina cf, Strain CCMP1243" /LENGTH=251 /DNA_ID=CAMNT_0006941027 /DNA_START=53 /DNA_END=808 /DNA_ORIENTATION=+